MRHRGWEPAARQREPRHRQADVDRKEQARRFRHMLSGVGLDANGAADLLRVHRRTVEKWLSGALPIPYMAYKLLRVLRYYELPGPWEGWQIAGGLLWTPEGRGFKPRDIENWGLLVRKAALFKQLYDEVSVMRRTAAGMSPELPPDNSRAPGRPKKTPVGRQATKKLTPRKKAAPVIA